MRIAWATRLRNKNIAPSAEETKVLKAFSSAPHPRPLDGYYPAFGAGRRGAGRRGACKGCFSRRMRTSAPPRPRPAGTGFWRSNSGGDGQIDGGSFGQGAPGRRWAQWGCMPTGARTPPQQALIQLATDKGADSMDRLNATDAIGYAVRLQVKGVRQDPPMFQALVSLLQDKDEPIRASANAILAPVYQPGSATPPLKAPAGGWQTWLNEITTKEAGYLKDYAVCGWGKSEEGTAFPGNRGSSEPEDLFCMGGGALLGQNLRDGPANEERPAGGIPIYTSGRRKRLCSRRGCLRDAVCKWQRRTAELRRIAKVVCEGGRGRAPLGGRKRSQRARRSASRGDAAT